MRQLLKHNKHSHPLIYMRGLNSENLSAILDFLYRGETNVLQENLDSFLALAEELRLKGLTGTDNNVKEPPRQTFENAPIIKRETAKQIPNPSRSQYHIPTNIDTQVAVENSSIVGNLENLDEQIRSLMTKTDVKTANGNHYLAQCTMAKL